VDFNRAGVPLLEIVSEPDITSPDMAYAYLNALTEILYQGGVSDCDMEKGMVRCDVNISVRPVGSKGLGAKIEIKNMNSFSGVRRALDYEIPRQIEAVKRGEKLIQSTRRWDDLAGITELMRTKEDAHDYRYFPEPDMMPLAPTDEWLAEVKTKMIELPLAYKQRIIREYGLSPAEAEVFKSNILLRSYFESEIKQIPQDVQPERRSKLIKTTASLLINSPLTKASEFSSARLNFGPGVVITSDTPYPTPFPTSSMISLSGSIHDKITNVSTAQQIIIPEMLVSRKMPDVIIFEKGLAQVSDTGAIEKFCDEAIATNPNPVADYKAGKVAALNSLKGQVMKLSKGKANPALVGEILERKLKG
jgi:aspartyl-tRNA(Asn)/glutamyl-tRNA(Gln) amidotransferase subunit B